MGIKWKKSKRLIEPGETCSSETNFYPKYMCFITNVYKSFFRIKYVNIFNTSRREMYVCILQFLSARNFYRTVILEKILLQHLVKTRVY